MNSLAAVGRRWRLALGGAVALVLFCLAALGSAWAQSNLQPVPALRAHVMDDSGTLAASDIAALEQQLTAFEQSQGTQIAVLLVPSTAPEDIADYTQRVAEAWKLGRQRVGDGLLVVVAVQDRRVRIAPYKALEGAVPDLLAKRVIDEHFVPAFRRGDYAGGLRDGLNALQGLIKGEGLPAPSAAGHARAQVDEFDIVEAAMLLFVAVPLISSVLRQMLGQRVGSVLGAGAAGGLIWLISGRIWMALLAGLIGFFLGLFTRGLPAPVQGPRYGSRHGGWGGPGWGGGWGGGGGFGGGGMGGGGGMSSGGGGDAGGGGASGSW